jgi:Peptidase propeptide and YPEB domain
MKMNRKHIAVGGLVVALSAGGVGAAVAAGGGEDASEQVSGPGADKARAAALAEHPGTANAVERDSENGGTWEVEITGNDGKTVDVRLDANYKVLVVEGDGENDSHEGEGEGN